jgi:hypothetical protein
MKLAPNAVGPRRPLFPAACCTGLLLIHRRFVDHGDAETLGLGVDGTLLDDLNLHCTVS